MKRGISIITVPALAVLAFTACDSGDGLDLPEATDDSGEDITLPDDVTLPDDITVPSIPDVTLPDGVTIPELTLPEGVTIPDLSLPDLSLPDLSGIEDALRAVWAQAGLSEEQIDCLLERIDLTSGLPDMEDATDFLDDCDVDAEDFLPGD